MNSERYTHAIVHGNGNELALSRDHAQALFLQGLSMGWDTPIVISFESALTEEEARNALKRLET
jgi:hypothetical protein